MKWEFRKRKAASKGEDIVMDDTVIVALGDNNLSIRLVDDHSLWMDIALH